MKQSLLILVLLSGCMVGPKFVPPCAPNEKNWSEENESISEAPVNRFWWENFQDPILNRLIEQAYMSNKDFAIAAWRVYESKAILGFAVGELFPQMQQATGSAQNVNISKNAPNTSPLLDFHFRDYNIGFQAAWELDFWGKYRRGIESADALLRASFASWQDVWLLVSSQTASTYLQYRIIQEQIQIVKENVAIQSRSLDIAKAQYDGGFVTELDVQQALVLLRDTQARLPFLYLELRRSETALATLLGVTLEDLGCFMGGDEKIPLIPKTAAIGMASDLFLRRPDVRQAYYAAWAQSAKVGIATADFYPQISLLGYVGWESSGGTVITANGGGGNLFSNESITSTWGPSFSWPILNYGRITNRVKAQQAILQQTLYAYQNTVLQAYKEVENAISLFMRSQDQTVLLQESVTAAARAVEIATKQYVEGLADFTRVLTTQEALLRSQERLTLARGATGLGLVALYKAAGGGI